MDRGESPKDPAGVRDFISQHAIDVVEAAAPDIHGTMRGKRFPGAAFAKVAELGFSAADALLCWSRQCELWDDISFSNSETGYPDLYLLPMPETLRQVPWDRKRATILCRLESVDGVPIAVDPRAILEQQVEQLEQSDLTLRVGIEWEFSLFDRELNPVKAGNQTYAFGHGAVDRFLRTATVELQELGLEVETAETEHGIGQLEIAVEPCDALEAADRGVRLKAAVKAIAEEQELIASFMPKPFFSEAGNGLHMNQSLWRSGENICSAEHADNGLARNYLAGLVSGARELYLLGAPTINSYKRRTSGSFAPTTSTWSRGSRTTGMRAMFGRGPQTSRLEHRTAGSEANPYLVLAGNLVAGRHGIEQALTPPAEFKGNAYEASEESLELPPTLREAAALFRTSDLASGLGREFVDHYATVVSHEADEFDSTITDWEWKRYVVDA